MAGRILPFPVQPTAARRHHPVSAVQAPLTSQQQAHRIALQVDREIAARVQREAAGRRVFGGGLPPQATEVGRRFRLLDALFFFARPA